MATISFKSVGKTRQERLSQQLINSSSPVSIATPLQLGSDEGIFKMHYNVVDSVNDNLKNLILTNWGDRMPFYDFGANIRPLLSDFVSQDDFDARAVENISGAVNKWMPYVSLETFQSTIDRKSRNNGLAIVVMTVVYSIPSLQVRQKALEVTMYVM